MKDGRVLEAARTKGFRSLAKIAQELIRLHSELFEGVEARSLAAKLSELNCNKLTWWINRPDQRQALQNLIAIKLDEIVAFDDAQQRGLWIFEEFPELPHLNLASDFLPNILIPVYQGDVKQTGTSIQRIEGWMRLGLENDYAQHFAVRPEQGVHWLHASKDLWLRLLLERFKAKGRLDVVEADTLDQAVARASRFRPVVLAPSAAVSVEDLQCLARMGDGQPVLVIASHALPTGSDTAASTSIFPSWEWLSATQSDRTRSSFSKYSSEMHGGLFDVESIVEFRMQLIPNWRDMLMEWIESLLIGRLETHFSATDVQSWLNTFDPDQTTFATPGAALSVARICHEVGEYTLPKVSSLSTGMDLVRRLGRTDTRHQNILSRLVCQTWLDTELKWEDSRSWSDWCAQPNPASRKFISDGKKIEKMTRRANRIVPPEETPPSESDLDMAFKAGLLRIGHDGFYGFRSYAEAALILRDNLRRWMLAGETEMWGEQTIGDADRQHLADDVIRTLSNSDLLDMSRSVTRLPLWEATALGASETLFIAIGRRMAAGIMSYEPELNNLLECVLARCVDDSSFIQLPLSRSMENAILQVDWLDATWGWSLEAPKPKWVPIAMTERFPGWAEGELNWLHLLPAPERKTPFSGVYAKHMIQAIRTATKITIDAPMGESLASPALVAIVGLHQFANGKKPLNESWWAAVSKDHWWAPDALNELLDSDRTKNQHELTASLLNACPNLLNIGLGAGIFSLIRTPLWLSILNIQNARDSKEVYNRLTSGAISFAIEFPLAIPPHFRKYLSQVIKASQIPSGYDWRPLIQSTGAPTLERFNQLTENGLRHSFNLANAMWSIYPDACLKWAMDSHNPHHDIFISECPSKWIALLVKSMYADSDQNEKLQPSLEWLADKVAHSPIAAPLLLDLLSRHYSESKHSKQS